ncbi:MAG TPA: SUKH-4 family immunity protein [Actinomadura sp.]|nr:SUKH-4 family immunity protein [Actinomadura sp.]
MTHERLAALFGEDDVWRPPESELPLEISHEPTRRFLSGVGLPAELRNGFLSLDSDVLEGRLETLPQVYEELGEIREWTWRIPEGGKHWYVLGGFFGGDVAVDGATGRVWFLPEWDGPPQPMHSGVDALAYFMYALERDRPLYSYEHARAVEDDDASPDDEIDVYEKAARKLVVELREIDPTPFTEEDAGPWTQAFEDIAGGQWG